MIQIPKFIFYLPIPVKRYPVSLNSNLLKTRMTNALDYFFGRVEIHEIKGALH